MKTLKIKRIKKNAIQTTGVFLLEDEKGNSLFTGFTLELPWRFNEKSKSCIPAGFYEGVLHESPRHGKSIWVKDVPGRDEILIHKGNYNKDTKGCILLGDSLRDINKDGYNDVTNSKNTVLKLCDLLQESSCSVHVF